MKIINNECRHILVSMLKYIRPYKYKIIMLYLVSIISMIIEMTPMYIIGKVIDFALAKQFEKIIYSIFLLMIIFIITSILSFIETYLNNLINIKLTYEIKKDIFYHIESLPISRLNEFRTGDLISRIQGDINAIPKFYLNSILDAFLSILKCIISILFIFKISISMSIISLCSFPFSFLIYFLFGKKIKIITQKGKKLSDDYYSFIQQSLASIRDIKILTVEKLFHKKHKILLDKVADNSMNSSIVSTFAGLINNTIINLSEWIIIGYGSWLIIYRNFSAGSYVSFNSYLSELLNSIQKVLSLNIEVQTTIVSINRILEIIGIDTEDYNNKINLDIIDGDIKIENLNFAYSLKEDYLIKDLSVRIKPNSICAFVGLSGCGKSTLFDLLVRFLEYDKGSISIDGFSIKDLNLKSLRKNVSYIQQENFIYNFSIKENLLLGSPNATMGEIVNACKLANIDSFIDSLPDKYDTLINEKGNSLSGGQKQRLAIARSILRNSKIFLFDEVTSALDGESEYLITESLMELSKNHTVIMIAHRLTTLINIPQIYVFDKGKIVDKGNHEYLIKNSSLYKRLYEKQWNNYGKNNMSKKVCR
ncbi:ABC transporter ATP-binding protein [Clostridium botulinum]|uniref:ABC transporter ATP-binding protein n=2 Tax=Clostridium botulinum TaxID=1491 RepID=UPI00031BC57B|nr:ABC transporter ATP-binding protein [Clostridium botulinum]APQ73754.1 ABC transporter family protein [Clostridium botulinum]APQ96542.1 ABC transporter family protein [Clostridium botulinum]MCR1165828.1 ABC transporter ATP-binding protein/permease [Clostridium botulinum]MCR1172006.1 ABC transporter ATP-binding protein/permease [Clostridium botulinum]MCR1178045.1 ABC transporter ATP-binding protein/permease [Clostridium botulinum]